MSLALLLSRISGLIREQVLGAKLGLGAEIDAVILVLTLPDLLIGLLLSGGFGAALIPALSKVDPGERVGLLRAISGWTLLASVGLAACVVAAMPVLVSALAPALDPSTLTFFTVGFALAACTIPVAAMVGLSSAYLNVKRFYSLPAYSVLAFNGTIIVYFLLGLRGSAVNFAVFGAVLLLASFLRLALQVIWMPEAIIRSRTDARFAPGFARKFGQGVVAYSLVVAVPILYRSLFALEGPGSLTQFAYALRVFNLQIGLLVAPLIVVFLPMLSELHGAQKTAFKECTKLAAKAAFTMSAIAAVLTAFFARPIAALLFGYGALSGEGADRVASTTVVLMIGLPFMALFHIMAAALNASGRTQRVLFYSLAALGISLVLYFALLAFGASPALSAKLGMAAFSVAACSLGMLGVLGKRESLLLLVDLSHRGVVILALVAPVGVLLPWTRDGVPTLGDLGVIIALFFVLLLVNRSTLMDLASLRDRQPIDKEPESAA